MALFWDIKNSINLSPTKGLIVQNLFWAIMGKFVNLLSGLLVGIIVARYFFRIKKKIYGSGCE